MCHWLSGMLDEFVLFVLIQSHQCPLPAPIRVLNTHLVAGKDFRKSWQDLHTSLSLVHSGWSSKKGPLLESGGSQPPSSSFRAWSPYRPPGCLSKGLVFI